LPRHDGRDTMTELAGIPYVEVPSDVIKPTVRYRDLED
jgi:hypothetical protein